MRRSMVLIALLLMACSPSEESLADCRESGEAVLRELLLVLEPIRTEQQLHSRERRLAALFNELARITIVAAKYADEECDPVDEELNERLRLCLERLAQSDSCRERLITLQSEALSSLKSSL